MLNITLPDGSVRQFENPTNGAQIAAAIGSGLAKAAIAVVVNGEERDLSDAITADAHVAIITSKDEAGVHIIRHSAAHLLGHALKQLWPEAKMVIGPVIENGFYYDIDSSHRFTPEDLEMLEKRMKELAATGYTVDKVWTPVAEARQAFSDRHEDFKVRLIDDFDDSVKQVGLYHHQEYLDMCRGPHVPHMGHVKAFKLTKLSGSYWRGDASGEPLQRIYGVAFADQKTLDAYLQQQAEAEKRDHRKLGKEMDLFSFHEEGPGFPFFHPKGMLLRQNLLAFWNELHDRYEYDQISTPIILNRQLWEQSGHWDHYRENMYFTTIDDAPYAIKPMNCPGGILVYKSNVHSYRDFPMRTAELGLVHRHELHGALHGLFRVRSFTQDDAHIFMLPSQMKQEITGVLDLFHEAYSAFGLEYHVELSTRPENSMGSDEIWELATKTLKEAIEEKGVPYQINEGDGAFYGPKLDFHVKDSIGRTWQCGTIQLDMLMPERFDMTYVGEDGQKHRPVMVHRACFGSIERFIGILVENYAGAFPVWLAPIQVKILPISEKHMAYAAELRKKFKKAGIRVELDESNEKIGYKIRKAQIEKVPYMAVIGDKEVETGTVSVRDRAKGDLGAQRTDEFIAHIKDISDSRKG